MAGLIASFAEVSEARLFLRLVGAPTHDNQLIIAIVALIRASGKGFDVGLAAASLLAGASYRISRTSTSVQIANKQLYQLALNAARGGNASDFLYALALSTFDPQHFGGYANGQIDPTKNRLFRLFGEFRGLNLTAPQKAAAQQHAKIPPFPRYLAPPPPRQQGEGYARQSFYTARHKQGSNVVSGGGLDVADTTQ